MLQYRQLSYTARGLLADLLSRPDGWREDGQHMADTSPQGRGAIRKALKELTAAGFYRVEKIRMPDGTIVSEAHVYDTPQLLPPPVAIRPASGESTTGVPDALSKERYKEPSLPIEQAAEPQVQPQGRNSGQRAAKEVPAVPDERLRKAAAALFQAIRPEPRLHLGQAEVEQLAPLVAQWLDRGTTPADLARALLPGLPAPLHSPAAVLRNRLERKMPPVQTPVRPAAARYAECARCHDPVPRPGICHPCAGLGERPMKNNRRAAVATRGAARVRAAVNAARSPLGDSGSLPLLQPGCRQDSRPCSPRQAAQAPSCFDTC
ncbi:hypothetical protein ACIQBJ_10570 [Kitasatospora sp. NPDC088391]|uniref:hypothetical protein n=1 Tax=Kitasatospora sp. NPDC088391 TaxID=3364074 RepID=UPI00381DF9FF